MLHDQRQWQLSRNRTVIFRRYDTSPTSNSRRRWPGNPNGRSNVRNLRLFMLARSQLMLRGGWQRQLHGWRWRLRFWWRLAEMFMLERLRCRRQTHRRQRPGNPNGRSKFRNLFPYASKIATNALAAASRLTEIVQTACCRRWQNRQRRLGDDQDLLKFHIYENVCLQDQAKPLEKHLVAVWSPLLWWHCALFFSYYHSQRLLFSPMKNNSRRPWLPPKNQDIHIEEFFRFYL